MEAIRPFSTLPNSEVLIASTVLVHQDGLTIMNVEGHRRRFVLARLVLGHDIAMRFKNALIYRDMSAQGVLFSIPPTKQDFGGLLAQFVDSEGAHCSVAAKAA